MPSRLQASATQAGGMPAGQLDEFARAVELNPQALFARIPTALCLWRTARVRSARAVGVAIGSPEFIWGAAAACCRRLEEADEPVQGSPDRGARHGRCDAGAAGQV
jgi:hypothetical protein